MSSGGSSRTALSDLGVLVPDQALGQQGSRPASQKFEDMQRDLGRPGPTKSGGMPVAVVGDDGDQAHQAVDGESVNKPVLC